MQNFPLLTSLFLCLHYNFPAVASGCGYQGNISSGLQFKCMVPCCAGSISLFHSTYCVKELMGLGLLSTANIKTVNYDLWKNQYWDRG